MENGVTIFKPKTAVMIRRDMARNPAVMAALEPLERSVFLASTDKTIAEYDSKVLAVELEKALKYIAKDVGYRENDPAERGYLIVRICEILKRYYGALTLRDFRMAFEMSITGELDEYLPKGRDGQADRGHYQQFNAEYVCKVLNAYKMRRGVILRKAYSATPSTEAVVTNSEKMEFSGRAKDDLLAAFAHFKETKMLPQISPAAEIIFYNILKKHSLVGEIEVTGWEQAQVLNATIQDYMRRGFPGYANNLRAAGKDAAEIQPAAFNLARVNEIKRAFANIIESGKELAGIL